MTISFLTRPFRGSAPLIVMGFLGLTLAGGCASRSAPVPQDPVHADGSLEAEADAALAAGVAAARSGDLAEAGRQAQIARDLARTPRQRRLAESLDRLIDGAQDLIAGRVEEAGEAWSQISDPSLRNEVIKRADRIGFHVPATPRATSSNKDQP